MCAMCCSLSLSLVWLLWKIINTYLELLWITHEHTHTYKLHYLKYYYCCTRCIISVQNYLCLSCVLYAKAFQMHTSIHLSLLQTHCYVWGAFNLPHTFEKLCTQSTTSYSFALLLLYMSSVNKYRMSKL